MRSTTASGYLHEGEYTSKPNFDVLVNSLATKIEFTSSKGKAVASSVLLATGPNGALITLYPENES